MKWQLSEVPQPLKRGYIAYLSNVEKYHRKKLGLMKLEWLKQHAFKAKASTFRDGQQVVTGVVDENAQTTLFQKEYDIKIEIVTKEVASMDDEIRKSFIACKTALDEYTKQYVSLMREWLPEDAGAPDPLTLRRTITEQIVMASNKISLSMNTKFTHWVEFQQAKQIKLQTRIQDECILPEALIEDIQKAKPVDEQLSSLRGIVSALSNCSMVTSSKNVPHRKDKRGKRSTSAGSANTSRTSSTHSKRSGSSHRSNQSNHSVKFSTPQKTPNKRHQHRPKKFHKRKPRRPFNGTPTKKYRSASGSSISSARSARKI